MIKAAPYSFFVCVVIVGLIIWFIIWYLFKERLDRHKEQIEHLERDLARSEKQSAETAAKVPVADIKPKTKEQEAGRLVIHRAIYGAGPQAEISIGDKLRSATRDALVIAVDNNLVPYDPAPNVRKHLDLDYSYGSDTVVHVSRRESAPGDIVRLVVPEDSEILRLCTELDRVTGQLTIARAKQMSLAHMQTELDWRKEWKEMESKFRALNDPSIFADQSDENDSLAWEIRSDKKTANVEGCKALCELAGSKLLASSPIIEVSHVVRSSEINWKRWLEFLKDTQGFTERYLVNSIRRSSGKSFTTQAGYIRNLLDVSVIVCIKCVATTYPKQPS